MLKLPVDLPPMTCWAAFGVEAGPGVFPSFLFGFGGLFGFGFGR